MKKIIGGNNATIVHFIVPSNAPIGSYNVYVGLGTTISAPYSWSISPPAPTSSSANSNLTSAIWDAIKAWF